METEAYSSAVQQVGVQLQEGKQKNLQSSGFGSDILHHWSLLLHRAIFVHSVKRRTDQTGSFEAIVSHPASSEMCIKRSFDRKNVRGNATITRPRRDIVLLLASADVSRSGIIPKILVALLYITRGRGKKCSGWRVPNVERQNGK